MLGEDRFFKNLSVREKEVRGVVGILGMRDRFEKRNLKGVRIINVAGKI